MHWETISARCAEIKGPIQNTVCRVLGARGEQGEQSHKPLTHAQGPRGRKEQSKRCWSHVLHVNEAAALTRWE